MSVKRHFLSIVLVAVLLAIPFGSVFAQEQASRAGFMLPIGIRVAAADEGIAITQIEPDSLAARASLQPGDVIRRINGRTANFFTVTSLAFKAAVDPDAVTLEVLRDGAVLEVQLGNADQLSSALMRGLLNGLKPQLEASPPDRFSSLRTRIVEK